MPRVRRSVWDALFSWALDLIRLLVDRVELLLVGGDLLS